MVTVWLVWSRSTSLMSKPVRSPTVPLSRNNRGQVVHTSVLLEYDSRGSSRVQLTALHIAAKKDDVKAAALLLQNERAELINDDATQVDYYYRPFLRVASHLSAIDRLRALVHNCSLN